MSGLRGCLVSLAFVLACAASPESPTARIEKKTADGLVLVEEHRRGALFVKPDHGISPHHRYHLNQILLTYERDSGRFTAGQEERIRQYVEDATIGGMIEGGAVMVTGPGRCVLSMGIGLVDMALVEPDGSGASTSILTSWGGVTLVVDLRNSLTGEPLLRYGRRVRFPGGIQWQDDRPPWRQVRVTLDELVEDQRKTLQHSVPPSTVVDSSCIPPDPEKRETKESARAF